MAGARETRQNKLMDISSLLCLMRKISRIMKLLYDGNSLVICSAVSSFEFRHNVLYIYM